MGPVDASGQSVPVGVPAARLESVSLSGPGWRALDEVTLEMPFGCAIGVRGANGSGKSSLFRVLAGLVKPTTGRAEVLGHAVGTIDAIRAVRGCIGEPRFEPHLTGRHTLRQRALLEGLDEAATEEAVQQFGLDRAADRPVRGYSQGMLKRLALAELTLQPGTLTILDEPFNGVDQEFLPEATSVVRRLNDGTRTVLLSSHDAGLLESLCDVIVVLDAGRCHPADERDE